MRVKSAVWWLTGAILIGICLVPKTICAEDLPSYLRDRGPGIPTSMFGVYVTKGQLLVYPFFEYSLAGMAKTLGRKVDLWGR